MKIDRENLARLETEYRGYLKGDRLRQFFDDFGIKLAAGHWCAGDFADRFAPVGYLSNEPNFRSDVISQIERVAQAGMKGIEFHEVIFIDRNYKKDEAVIQRTRETLAEYKLIPTNMNTNLWTDPKWKFRCSDWVLLSIISVGPIFSKFSATLLFNLWDALKIPRSTWSSHR